jgi:TM2 domain-containing membrane protein YozV
MKQRTSRRNPLVAAILSLIVPGLGQIYCGDRNRGPAIIVGAIVVANLNILILPLISIANPTLPPETARAAWAYWIPRIVHDVSSLWSLAFWVWAVVDAFWGAKKPGTPIRRRSLKVGG